MIKADQPDCFPQNVVANVSSVADGQMQLGWSESQDEVVESRRRFLAECDIDIKQTVLLRVRYGDELTYDVIEEVGTEHGAQGMYALEGGPTDCLITNQKEVALFLPIADCVATVVHDPIHNVLALVHLGRHSTVANLAEKLVTYLLKVYNTDPKDLIIWMAPSLQKQSHILQYADFANNNLDWQPYCTRLANGFLLDMQGYNHSRFIAMGVPSENITISSVDTGTNSNYWSHYTETTIRGHEAPPRFAVVCMMK
ncbi:MAG: purine-nucleoside/S-methyl-5-thioadenosine phosphorylase / adenosine deaminase [Patescibacteria group bacterium]|jgi:copper oxidase (laccase) domain-containing protein|nr:purine-nucleoside/S-methyl-5-thioadenosine phosphorylase / adenosine deaminase [Patescibacteria group bacterium]